MTAPRAPRPSKRLVERAAVVVSVTNIVRAARRDGPGRTSGYVEAHAGSGAEWIAYEVDLDEAIARLDARLISTALIGTTVELYSRQVAHHPSRQRWTFGCPRCAFSVRLLYVADLRRPEFACRRCSQLAYLSTRVNAAERAALRAHRLRREVEGTPVPLWEPFPERPKRMRWARWIALEERDRANLAEYAEGITAGTASPALMVG